MLRRKPAVPDELRAVDAALRSSRPRLSDERMARLVADATAVGEAATPTVKESFVRSRLAITAMLVAGLFCSFSGAGLAVSSLTGGGQTASEAQYNTPSGNDQGTLGGGGGVLGENQSGGPSTGAGQNGNSGVAPASGGENPTPSVTREQGSNTAGQVAAQSGGGTLPFTGWAAIPVLIVGFALLGAGLMLRRSTRSARAD